MHKHLIQSLIASIFMLSAGATMAAPPDIPPGLLNEAKNSFIFVFTSDVTAKEVPGLAKGLAKKANGSVRKTYSSSIKGFSANMSAKAAANLAAKNPNIAYYEQNGVASIPVKSNKKGGNKPPSEPPADPSQITPWGVNRVGGAHDGTGKTAWIIDSGIDINNTDFNRVTDTSSPQYGRNFVGNAKKPQNIKDKNGHGTHVAGTLTAIDNTVGVVGVAENATVVPLKVFGASGQGFVDDIIEAVDYAAANAAPGDVVNMSLVTYGNFVSLSEAIGNTASSGIMFAVCAGNDSDDVSGYDPASYEYSNVRTITAMDGSDSLASFSNHGSQIDYAAPGVDVESYVLNGETRSWDGCSMATPHVAGIMLILGEPITDGSAGDTGLGVAYPVAHF